jgi:hypothetical protein
MDQPVQAQNPVLDKLALSAKNMAVWAKFIGIVNIVMGALTALSLVGIIIAWLPIWMGVILFQAGSRADEAYTGKKYDQLIPMMDKLRMYFLVQGILIIVGVAVTILSFVIFGAGMFAMFDQMNNY